MLVSCQLHEGMHVQCHADFYLLKQLCQLTGEHGVRG